MKKNLKKKKTNKKTSIKKSKYNSVRDFFINTLPTKRYKILLFILITIFVILLFRIGYLQFIDGNSLKEQAFNQQTTNSVITAKRGTIYDSTRKSFSDEFSG